MTDLDNLSSVLAIKIASSVLMEQGALFGDSEPELWLILREGFVPEDQLPRYYLSEIPALRTKSVGELRAIHRVKMEFLGSRVRE